MDPQIEIPHARLQDLERLHDFIDAACRGAGADDSVAYALALAVEEASTNIMVHGYAGAPPGPIALRFHAEPGQITITIADEARPFSPDSVPPPDLTSDLEERKIGGLGWYLIRKMVDEVRHEFKPNGRGNVLTLVKRIGDEKTKAP